MVEFTSIYGTPSERNGHLCCETLLYKPVTVKKSVRLGADRTRVVNSAGRACRSSTKNKNAAKGLLVERRKPRPYRKR